MIVGKALNKIINIFTGMFGIATLILMLITYIQNALPFQVVPAQAAINIGIACHYCTLGTVFCAGLEFTLRRGIVLAIIFAAIIVAVAAFMVYTDVIAVM